MKTEPKDVRFMHIRKHSADGKLKSTEGATIATKKDIEGNYLYYVARCSKRDVFNKRIGRMVAAGKLQHYGCLLGPVPQQSLQELVLHLCRKYRQQFSEKSFSFLIQDGKSN